jgi:hypothetical protein
MENLPLMLIQLVHSFNPNSRVGCWFMDGWTKKLIWMNVEQKNAPHPLWNETFSTNYK